MQRGSGAVNKDPKAEPRDGPHNSTVEPDHRSHPLLTLRTSHQACPVSFIRFDSHCDTLHSTEDTNTLQTFPIMPAVY